MISGCVIRNNSKGSAAVVRKAVRCHQCNRFFTLCHRSVSLLSQTAFLPPFWMTIGGKGIIMRKTSGVILSDSEGSAAVVRKAVRCHPGNRILHSVSPFRLPAFSNSILVPVQNDDWRKWRHNEENVRRHPKRTWRICCCGKESRKKIKAISCELSATS